MQDNGLDGVFLQQFVSELKPGSAVREFRDVVQDNVKKSAEETDREFAIMYDISGISSQSDLEVLTEHWKKTVDEGVTESNAYLKDNGLPVLAIWES